MKAGAVGATAIAASVTSGAIDGFKQAKDSGILDFITANLLTTPVTLGAGIGIAAIIFMVWRRIYDNEMHS